MSKEPRLAEQVAWASMGFSETDSEPTFLTSLSAPLSTRALAATAAFKGLSPADRRALMSREFGYRRDADVRLRALFGEATHELRMAMYLRLPPFLRSLFPELRDTVGPGRGQPTPGVRALAARLVQEAIL